MSDPRSRDQDVGNRAIGAEQSTEEVALEADLIVPGRARERVTVVVPPGHVGKLARWRPSGDIGQYVVTISLIGWTDGRPATRTVIRAVRPRAR